MTNDELFGLYVTKQGLAILLAGLRLLKFYEKAMMKPAERAAVEELMLGIRKALEDGLEERKGADEEASYFEENPIEEEDA